MIVACNNSKEKENPNQTEEQMNEIENPLLSESILPYGAPDFSKIKDEHFKPAMLEGIKQQKKAVEAIANSEDEPTFENTIVAMEKAGKDLDRVFTYYGIYSSNISSEEFREIQQELAPEISNYRSQISQNAHVKLTGFYI